MEPSKKRWVLLRRRSRIDAESCSTILGADSSFCILANRDRGVTERDFVGRSETYTRRDKPPAGVWDELFVMWELTRGHGRHKDPRISDLLERAIPFLRHQCSIVQS